MVLQEKAKLEMQRKRRMKRRKTKICWEKRRKKRMKTAVGLRRSQ